MEKKTVVLYPGLAVSHFVPMMHLAGVLLEHGYAVSVALIDPSVKEDIAFAAVVRRVAASMPSVSFHTLPAVEEDPPRLTHDAQFFLRYIGLVRSYNERLHSFLRSSPTRVHAVVVDSASSEAIRVTRRLGIPSYTLFTASATTFAAFTQIIADAPLELFGLPVMPVSDLFGDMLGPPDSETYKLTVDLLRQTPEADGTLVNTFESLEARTLAALRDPMFVPGRVLSPVYCVGPFVGNFGNAEAAEDPRHECLAWLDGQPDGSVVFLCFGSIGAGNHSGEQLREIAIGLEESGHRFLWVVRAPIGIDHDPRADPDLDALLPDGFSERTNGSGLVVKLWAPQMEVLRHRATGAFVSRDALRLELGAGGRHGGRADVVLAVVCRAEDEQASHGGRHEDRRGDDRLARRLVKAAEVDGKIRLVMESEEGRELRARVAALRKGTDAACSDGGSSRLAFAQFLADMDSRQDPSGLQLQRTNE